MRYRGLLLSTSALLAILPQFSLSQTPAISPGMKAYYIQQTALQRKGTAALKRVDERRKEAPCDAAGGGDLAIRECLQLRLKVTQADYVDYEFSIGGLLRLPEPGDPKSKPMRLSFDDGESAWAIYREKTCKQLSETYGEGTGAAGAELDCRIKLTENHMRDLSYVYGELWQ